MHIIVLPMNDGSFSLLKIKYLHAKQVLLNYRFIQSLKRKAYCWEQRVLQTFDSSKFEYVLQSGNFPNGRKLLLKANTYEDLFSFGFKYEEGWICLQYPLSVWTGLQKSKQRVTSLSTSSKGRKIYEANSSKELSFLTCNCDLFFSFL